MKSKVYSIDFNSDIKNITPKVISEAKKLFNKNGFVVLKNSISKKIILKVKKDLESTIKDNKISNKLRDIHFFKNGEISSAHNLFDYVYSYKKFLNTSNALRAAQELGDFDAISEIQSDYNSIKIAYEKIPGYFRQLNKDGKPTYQSIRDDNGEIIERIPILNDEAIDKKIQWMTYQSK